MEEHQTGRDMIDVTDSLEARDAFRGMKNFCFRLLLVCLLLLQGLFWFQQSGGIASPESSDSGFHSEKAAAAGPSGETALAALEPPSSTSAPSTEAPLLSNGSNEAAGPIVQAAQEVTEEIQAGQKPEQEKINLPSLHWPPFRLPVRQAWVLISGLNAIVLFSAVLYCLVLVFLLKISLVGRLGGISHISRAFFLSLFLLIFLFPWQCLLPGVLLGVLYLPSELLEMLPARADGSKFWLILVYLRFAGFWILAIWLLLWSAIRSGKWYRTTQRRLGIVG